tara:strand:- start:359 stop:547 length:189 start_codon:yes stop_codon:yes gene_type:complete
MEIPVEVAESINPIDQPNQEGQTTQSCRRHRNTIQIQVLSAQEDTEETVHDSGTTHRPSDNR